MVRDWCAFWQERSALACAELFLQTRARLSQGWGPWFVGQSSRTVSLGCHLPRLDVGVFACSARRRRSRPRRWRNLEMIVLSMRLRRAFQARAHRRDAHRHAMRSHASDNRPSGAFQTYHQAPQVVGRRARPECALERLRRRPFGAQLCALRFCEAGGAPSLAGTLWWPLCCCSCGTLTASHPRTPNDAGPLLGLMRLLPLPEVPRVGDAIPQHAAGSNACYAPSGVLPLTGVGGHPSAPLLAGLVLACAFARLG